MKKLLVLALVLSIAGFANAGFSLNAAKTEVNPGEVVSIQLVNDLGGISGFGLGYVIVPEGVEGVLTGADLLPAAGNQSGATAYTEAGFGTGFEVSLADTTPGGAGLVAGPQIVFTYIAPMAEGVYSVVFYNDALGYDAPEATAAITVIPEPMTMLLLGLGGLFLRRK